MSKGEVTSGQKTVYLHIGLHKTGTTFLQNVLRANSAALAEQGVIFPGRNVESQKLAVWDLFGRRPKGAADGRINGQWNVLVDEINSSDLPVGLVSEEYLSLATARQAARAVASFPDAVVHVVVTARDLGRVLLSAWQEEVKNDATWTWSEFAEAVHDPAARAKNPARGFWLRQDLAAITETWGALIPAERMHIVTVPPQGSPPGLLFERFAGVIGINSALLTEEPPWNNATVGPAATEILRRLNELLGHKLNQRQYRRVVKTIIAPAMARGLGSPKFGLPPENNAWVAARATEIVGSLECRGYSVVGDLSELLPVGSEVGRRPDDATNEELLEASMVALTELVEVHAKAWWQERKPDKKVQATSTGRAVGAARGLGFRVRRRAAEAADRNRFAGKLMGIYLDRRTKGR